MFYKLIFSIVKLVPIFFIPTLLLQNNFTPEQGALSVTIVGVSSVAGRLAFGLTDSVSNHALKMTAGLSATTAVALAIMITHQTSLTWLYVSCSLYGFCFGPLLPLGPTCFANLVGTGYEEFSCAMSWNLAIAGLGDLTGAFFEYE